MTTPKGGKPRRIQKTQHTLMTVVASHPATMEEVRTDTGKKREVAEWERRTIGWLRQQYRDRLVSVVRHEDESHYHIHAYVLPDDPAMRATALHPGQCAKAAIMAAGPAEGEDTKALNKRGDLAYRAAMREWQDSYHEMVAIPSGLTRLGPQRRRLTRDEWQREQAQAKALQKTIERAQAVKDQGKNYIEKTKAEAAAIAAAAQEEQEAAKQAAAAAHRDQEKARQEKLEATMIMADAAQYSGLAGRARAMWDKIKESELIKKLRAEFEKEIQHWKDRARNADEKRIEAESKLYEAERRERQARDEAMRAGIERDRLRALLAKSDSFASTMAVDRSPRLDLKPNLRKEEDEKRT
ncbi:plasmid recombination protein [Rhizobium sp. C4]|uniref:plasmid recombination protein n=1 Tax=Rhizobium sp. C4 TaxID=1349800 RepID=UPI001E61B2B5|nr:plasmid recombination protein [Rhizobium sp. C4]MCD2173038.1 plasmid recombination protein [Rhizobium sp. C4]